MHISIIMCKNLILLKNITRPLLIRNSPIYLAKNSIIMHNIMLSAPKNPSS